jgi:hypothetical protein
MGRFIEIRDWRLTQIIRFMHNGTKNSCSVQGGDLSKIPYNKPISICQTDFPIRLIQNRK